MKEQAVIPHLSTEERSHELVKQAPSRQDFRTYVFAENKVYNWVILLLMLAQFIIFKLMYPFPDFFSDSYSYIFAAYAHLDVNIWPTGYSRFLSLFHFFSHSGLALVGFQYLVFALSGLYFYHTLIYFYHTGKNTRIFLCLFLFFNPLFLYVANYVTSDILFISMSLLWLTQLIWILQRPKLYQVFVQAILMFVMFTFRYNAMIYPLIAAGVFLLSKQRTWVKVVGIVSGPLLIVPFIIWASLAAKKMTGTAQFPPILGGWQWGNNALYMREFVEEDSTKFPTPETAELDRIARQFFRTVPPQYRDLPAEVANFFFRHPEAPLKQYMSRHFHPKDGIEDVVAWGKCAVVFDQYGKYVIRRHPLAFAQHYLLVNTKNYFLPPLEKLEIYNLGLDEMWPMGQYWFHYPSPKVVSVSKTLQGTLLALFPMFFLVVNLYFGIGLILFIRKSGFRSFSREWRYTLLVISVFLALNCAFSIFANIIVIRYQILPMIVFLAFAMLLTDHLEILGYEKRRSQRFSMPKQGQPVW
jgi:hypothetical protein